MADNTQQQTDENDGLMGCTYTELDFVLLKLFYLYQVFLRTITQSGHHLIPDIKELFLPRFLRAIKQIGPHLNPQRGRIF